MTKSGNSNPECISFDMSIAEADHMLGVLQKAKQNILNASS